jgi:hypothetical protein
VNRSACAFALALVSLIAVLAPAPARADRSYSDPAGDGSGAPDVTRVEVRNGNDGNVAFSVKVTGVAADARPLAATEPYLALFVDTDRRPRTGNGDGADVLVGFDLELREWAYFRWDGARFASRATRRASDAVFTREGVELSLDAVDLGGADAFDFWLVGRLFEGDTEVAADVAPDGSAVWTYTLATKPVVIFAARPHGIPPFPVAGGTFTIVSLISRDGAPATAGLQTTCVVRLGGIRIAARASYSPGGLARCVVRLPPRSQKRLLTGSIGVSLPGGRASRSFRFRVL